MEGQASNMASKARRKTSGYDWSLKYLVEIDDLGTPVAP